VATRPPGGAAPASGRRSRRARFGSKRTRCQLFGPSPHRTVQVPSRIRRKVIRRPIQCECGVRSNNRIGPIRAPLMASLGQLETNCRNALISTGPATEEGKRRSRRNALHHGLTAETVVDVLEDPEDYKAFERSIAADFDAQTAVERELVLRLASLLWRLRRTTAIETGLLEIADHWDETAKRGETEATYSLGGANSPSRDCVQPLQGQAHSMSPLHPSDRDAGQGVRDQVWAWAVKPPTAGKAEIARRFIEVTIANSGAFDRLSRYENTLWRQVGAILLTLSASRFPYVSGRRRSRLQRTPWV
jgi:hypothetical protein